MKTLLKGGYFVNSSNRTEGYYDVLISDNVIENVGENLECEADEVIDCKGLTVIPGICDMHVHFRDPGQTHKEDIFTGAEAAAAGGVTAVACMPNTIPAVAFGLETASHHGHPSYTFPADFLEI